MVSLEPDKVRAALLKFRGQPVYVHLEVNPGAYWRNGSAKLQMSHVKGDGPYRVFLELDDGVSLIQIDNLTHMLLENDLVIVTGYDEQSRLARTLEVSVRPFSMVSEAR